MAISFPTGLDSLTRYVDGTTVFISATQNNMQLAIEALEVKVGIDSSAVTTSHDYLIGEKAAFASSGAVMWNNASMTAADTWQELDMSATIGVNLAVVYLEITTDGAGTFAVKPQGFGGSFAQHNNSGGGGTNLIHFDANGDYGNMVCVTDATGAISMAADTNTVSYTVKLIAYLR